MNGFDALLSAQSSVVLNASGYGVIRFAPQGELWEVQRMTLQCSDYAGPPVNEAIGRIYVDAVSPPNVIATAYAASSGTTAGGEPPIRLTDGQPLFVEWTGGTPNVTATVTFSGIRSNPQGGFRAIR